MEKQVHDLVIYLCRAMTVSKVHQLSNLLGRLSMEWNSDDPFIKWFTRIYVVLVLIGMPTAYYLILEMVE
jgi:hypothetical protein